jgi:hypothetical protein
MRSLNSRYALVLAAVVALGPLAYAQQGRDGTVARLVDMQGNVLVSRESGLASGNEQLRLLPGTRVITTARSEVVVEYDDGCRVRVKENQRFEVEHGKPCALLLAQDILAPVAIANSVIPAVLIGAALLPYGGAGSVPPIGGSGGEIPISPN